MVEFYKIKKPVAKKEHDCEFCKKQIEIGEKYSYESGKVNGDFTTRTLCLPCYEMMRESCIWREDAFEWEDVSSYLKDKYCCTCANNCGCDEFPETCIFVRKNYYTKSGQ